jgi:phytoene dehydrogenase-like protein
VENGKAVGIVLQGGETVRAKTVVAACHVATTFNKLLAPADVPGDLLDRIRHINIGNGFGATVRCTSSELPDYGDGQQSRTLHGMQLLCPSEEFLRDAYSDYFSGYPSRKPPVLAMTFSPIDDTLAPPGKHVLSLWSQYFPYKRRDGRHWDDCADELADSVLNTLFDYAPNLRGKIEQQYVQTPFELERRIGLIQGNVMHIEMSLDQMFAFRPLPELAHYSTPIANLFLCGASTHPGGGVFGASGLNVAGVVNKHLRQGWRRFLPV